MNRPRPPADAGPGSGREFMDWRLWTDLPGEALVLSLTASGLRPVAPDGALGEAIPDRAVTAAHALVVDTLAPEAAGRDLPALVARGQAALRPAGYIVLKTRRFSTRYGAAGAHTARAAAAALLACRHRRLASALQLQLHGSGYALVQRLYLCPAARAMFAAESPAALLGHLRGASGPATFRRLGLRGLHTVLRGPAGRWLWPFQLALWRRPA